MTTNLRSLWNDDNLFWEAIVLSVMLHSLLFHAGAWSIHFQQKHTVEIDITNMGHLGMAAPPRMAPAPAPARPAPKPVAPPKEWTKPRAESKSRTGAHSDETRGSYSGRTSSTSYQHGYR